MSIDRRLVRPLLVVCGVCALVVGLIWALGGFRPAQAVGRPTPPGQQIEMQRWTFAVLSCELTDREVGGEYGSDPAARVWIRTLNTTDETLQAPADDVITARLGITDLADPQFAPGQTTYGLGFDPDIAAVGAYDFPLPAPLDVDAPPGAEVAVTVLVHDERNRQNFALRSNWWAEEPIAEVTMSCPDRRVGDE